MVKNKKIRTHHTKSAFKRTKSSKKNKSNPWFAFLSRFTPRSRKGVIRIALVVIALVVIGGAIPFPYTFAKSTTVTFDTVDENYTDLEMGDSKILQDGRDGRNTVNVESLQSIWGRLLGLQPVQQKEVNTIVEEMPVDKIVANGSRKYQYMLCSDGSSRYYTDEQFKNPNVGFTSKSNDNCKESNQGVKLKLADSQDGAVNNQTPPNVISTTSVPKACRQSSIPFGTEYQNASYLPRGTQQVASQGVNGFILSCPGKEDIKSSGVNQLILVGTGKTDAEIQSENDAEEVRIQQEETARTQRYYINLANCVQSLKAQGMQSSSAESHCRGIVRR